MNKTAYLFMTFFVVIAIAFGGSFTTAAFAASDTLVSENQTGMLGSNTYYVSPTGSDSNPGSASAPFKTFAKAASVLAAGDTLQVMAGTYTESLTVSASGTSAAPITVIGNGAKLDMQGVKANGISISGSYITVSGFEVLGATDFGIYITGSYVTVENNNLHDNVTRNGVGECGISSSWGSALKVKVGGENTTIRNNTVYNNCGEGIAVTRGVTALVENNTAYDNFSVNIYVDNSPFVTVQNNTSYCTGTHLMNGYRATGIALGEETYSGWGAQLHDVLISGNTIANCHTGIAAFESEAGGTLTNVAILNNNIPSGDRRSISLQTVTNQNVLVANNLIFNSIYVYQPEGVTLGYNPIGSSLPTSTSLPPSPTSTAPVNPTSTLFAPTVTSSPAPALPTSTNTPVSGTATIVPPSATFTFTAVPPTTTAVVNSPVPSETIYDDKDDGFVYSSGWQDMNDGTAYGGSYKVTNQNGASVNLGFTGQSFSILYMGGSSNRRILVYVDEVRVGTINQRTSTSQLRWDYAGQLAPGNHVLKLVFDTPNKNGRTNGSVDAVIVR